MNRAHTTPPPIPKSKRGMTIMEMLCTIVTLLLMTMLVTTGVKLAANTFTKTISSSHARILCSNLQTVVSDELLFSTTLDLDDDRNIVSFYSTDLGKNVQFSTDADGHILLGGRALLSANAYPYELRASVELGHYDSTTNVIPVRICVTNSSGTELASVEFDVKPLTVPALT